MPELPEVETVRRILERNLINEEINNIDVYYDKVLKEDFKTNLNILKNQKIEKFERYGKYLVIILTTNVIIIHLRMEGKFYIDEKAPVSKHEHVVFKFKSGKELRYHDVRKFGTFHLRTKENYLNTYPLNEMGMEPQAIEINDFYEKIVKMNRPIKAILLDQKLISGLGNIYVDETLFRAKVNPKRLGKDITLSEAKLIIKSAIKVLDEAIIQGGTTIKSYTSSLGVTGLFQQYLLVHTKKGEPCPVCGTIIVKDKVAGRGTYFCEKCQI